MQRENLLDATGADALRLPEPTRERWQLLRAGIQNVWEYDDQRFVFNRGRLLLRGQNESGKTKALEVLLPFLLDASLRPERLDPFGSSSRSMSWNLLSDANPDVATQIGYVWLEFGRRDGEARLYRTVGAGLRAKRSTPGVDDWYFHTSLRIDRDLSLYDSARVPLRASRLAELIGADGRVFEKAAEYRRELNELLFGMPEEQYSALVEALLQLRRPQLSKVLDPEGLSRILNASLPPLDAGAIGSLAEGFERLDRHRSERDDLRHTHEAVRDFLGVYRGYATSYLKARALELTRADSTYHGAREALRKAQAEEGRARERLAGLTDALRALATEDRELGARLAALRSSEEFRAIEALDRAEAEAREAADAAGIAARRADRDGDGVRKAREAAERAERQVAAAREGLAARRGEVARAAHAAELVAEHDAVDALIGAGNDAAARGALEAVHRNRAAALAALRAHAEAVRAAGEAVRVAHVNLANADELVREARAAHAEAAEAEARELERFGDATIAWAGGLEVLPLAGSELVELAPADRRKLAEARARAERERRAQAQADATLALARVVDQREGVQSERDALARETHRAPRAPTWRGERPEGRPGAPLYLLCDFAAAVDDRARARIEAALEGSGLLDAWVLPDGALLDSAQRDVALSPAPVAGSTLADVLTPADGAPVSAEVVGRVLRSVALLEAGATSDAPAWIALDGRFKLGPLHGANDKPAACYVGTTARERARQQRLAELEAQLAALELDRSARQQDLDGVQRRIARLREELDGFPSFEPVREAELKALAAAEALARARTRRDARASLRDAAEAQQLRAVAQRDAEADRLRLRAWVERLDELRASSAAYREASMLLLVDARDVAAEQRRADQDRERLHEASGRLAESEAARDEAAQRAQATNARATALRQSLGKTKDELLGEIRAGDLRRREIAREVEAKGGERSSLDQRVGAAEGAVKAAAQRETDADGRRREADGALRRAAQRGLLRHVELAEPKPIAEWSYTEALHVARTVAERTARAEGTPEEQDRILNRLGERHAELSRSLREGIRVFAERTDGFTDFRATYNGREQGLLDLELALATEIDARERLLGSEEQALFESFLTGEAHEHVRQRLLKAQELVDRMNAQLEERPTSSGMKLRLKWEVAEDAPAGAAQAVELLLRTGALLTDANREELVRFLQQRLAEARADEGAATLQERMLRCLDYRLWRSFAVEFRTANEPWKRLTRKVHGAGSGGQKAVLLHLPLFAAASAFYASASPTSPRMIMLDEAFAGIDRETRAQLMGLLVAFDLDFLMTSFEEWGFYPQLDGISTYHLARERGMRGVYADWFLWDGRERCHVTG